MSAPANHHYQNARMDLFAIHAPAEIPPWFAHGDDLPPTFAELRERFCAQVARCDAAIERDESTEPQAEPVGDERVSMAEINAAWDAYNKLIDQNGTWRMSAAIAAARAAKLQAEPTPLHLGACITDGKLYVTAMRYEDNRTLSVVATAELDVDALVKGDCHAVMTYATTTQVSAAQAGQQVTAPEGYALVPAVPTHNMLYALLNESEAAVMRDKGTSDDTSRIVL
ncbi:hypothetical protein LBW62_24970, partial [Ralstonia solanacearum]|uniref:hypothetical protein n=1 Tax=Ralstonia solanacearum TaxID=305 RepID=UPI002305CB92